MTEGQTYETTTVEGTIENAFGRKLDKPLNYKGEYRKLLSFDAIPDNERLSEKDILGVVNEARKANARQKAMAESLEDAGIKKPVVGPSAEGLIEAARVMVKTLVATGKSESDAIQLAETMLGVKL